MKLVRDAAAVRDDTVDSRAIVLARLPGEGRVVVDTSGAQPPSSDAWPVYSAGAPDLVVATGRATITTTANLAGPRWAGRLAQSGLVAERPLPWMTNGWLVRGAGADVAASLHALLALRADFEIRSVILETLRPRQFRG